MSSELESKMVGALTQLLVMEGMEAEDKFYFEFGQELKDTLLTHLSADQVAIAKRVSKEMITQINVDVAEAVPSNDPWANCS